jgi:hypothetical protein
MLDFLGKAVQGIVAKLRRLAAEFRRFVAQGIGAPAKPVGYAAQHRGNGLPDVVGGLHGTRGSADTNTFQRFSIDRKRRSISRILADFGAGNIRIDQTSRALLRSLGALLLIANAHGTHRRQSPHVATNFPA